MARQFANHVASERERLSIPAEQAERLSAAVQAYRDALYQATWTDAVGPRATRIKNTAREEAEKIVRAVGRTLRGCEAVSGADRISLNMHEREGKAKAPSSARRSCRC